MAGPKEWRKALLLAVLAVAQGGWTYTSGDDCTLLERGADRAAASDCMRCHGTQTHPVDLDYAAAAERSRGSLRSAEEAIRRGVFLPDGRLKCVTCHDPASPWKDKIALPPGSIASPAVNPRDRSTYTGQPSRRHLLPGASVTPTPLCRACHAVGD